MCSAKIAEPYVVTSPAVSSRSLTASRMPSPWGSGRARKIPGGSVVVQVDERDEDGAAGDQQGEDEQCDAESHVLPCDLGGRLDREIRRPLRDRLGQAFRHPSTGSSAIATNSSAR